MPNQYGPTTSIRGTVAKIPKLILSFGIVVLILVVLPVSMIGGLKFQRSSVKSIIDSNIDYIAYLISINDITGINRHLRFLTELGNMISISLDFDGFSFHSDANIEKSPETWNPLTIQDSITFPAKNSNQIAKISWRSKADLSLITILFGSACVFVFAISALVALLGNRLSSLILQPFEEVETSFSNLDLENLRYDSEDSRWTEVRKLKLKFNEMIDRLKSQSELRSQLIEFQTKIALGLQVAHDIKSPLSFLFILAKKSVSLNNEERSMLDAVAQRLNKIVDDLSDKGQVETQHIDISDFISSIVREKSLEFQVHHPNIKISLVQKDSGEILSDKTKLSRVLSNLFNNSAEAYAGNPGEIQVEVTIDSQGRTNLTVGDKAGGIARSVLDKILSGQMITTKEGHSGLGLKHALNVAKEIGAELDIQSTVGNGTRFNFIFKKL